jgi:hypothetical protein
MVEVIREKYDARESVVRILATAGGVNRYGEPNYRAVWGWNRLAWIGGKFEDRDPHGRLLREVVELRQEPKYAQLNRWHVERWVSPEAYGSPRLWYAQTIEREGGVSVPALGPYPERGEYEHCFTVQTPRGDFVQLTATIAEHVARAIERSRCAPRSAGRSALYEKQDLQERAYDQWAYAIMDDTAPAMHGQPFVAVG